VAAAVDDDYGVMWSERLDLMAPIVRIGNAAVQKHDGRSVADGGVIKVDAIHLATADMLTGDRSRSRRKTLP
jgi:hypothetical protein